MIEFRKLTAADQKAFMDYYKEWPKPADMVPSVTDFSRYESYDAFLSDINNREASQEWVKNSTFFYFVGRRIVGAGNVRHDLNPALLETGGHVGYGVRPSERNKGYASIILQHCLQFLMTLGVERALITCDDDNPASASVILKNGGQEDESFIQEDGMKVRRFWIHI